MNDEFVLQNHFDRQNKVLYILILTTLSCKFCPKTKPETAAPEAGPAGFDGVELPVVPRGIKDTGPVLTGVDDDTAVSDILLPTVFA